MSDIAKSVESISLAVTCGLLNWMKARGWPSGKSHQRAKQCVGHLIGFAWKRERKKEREGKENAARAACDMRRGNHPNMKVE